METQHITNLLKKLNTAESIYDVATMIHQALTTRNENSNLRKYREQRAAEQYTQHTADLIRIVQVMCGNPINDFRPALDEMIRLFSQHPEFVVALMMDTLFAFDNEFSELQGNRQNTLLPSGPMNFKSSQSSEQASLYLMPKDALQSRFIKGHHLRYGRNLLYSHPSGINSKLNNYTVIPHNLLGGLVPKIWECYLSEEDQDSLRDGPLRLVVFPFGSKRWFTPVSTKSSAEFDIRFDIINDEILISAYKKALEFAERIESDIVVFPEMGLGTTVLKQVQSYLFETMFERNHLKFIFCGSEWINGANRAYILNAKGEELLSQMKRESVEPYDKVANETSRENLCDHDGVLSFLDIAGLGRVSYSICRDFTDSHQKHLRADLLRSGLHIASSFTSNVELFYSMAEGVARDYAAVSLVCNCCAALKSGGTFKVGQDVGFLSVPICTVGKQVRHHSVSYTILEDRCMKEECGLCSCAVIYTLTYSQNEDNSIEATSLHMSI